MPETIYGRSPVLAPTSTHYCPGCTHGVIHRLVAEVIDELGIRSRTVGVTPVGCSVLAYNYFAVDFQEASHGRAPAVATGLKRARPELIVFAYQGDGDLASIGTAEIVHCANRGEKVTVVFVNNAIYGMTGGQMAPTTLPGQPTTTCALGRNVDLAGYPLRMAELLSTLRTPAFIARGAVHTPRATAAAKRLLRQAFRHQIDNTCFSLVELLSTCPTNWGMSAVEAGQWLQQHMIPYYPLGIFRTPSGADRAPLPLIGEHEAWNTRSSSRDSADRV
jgi:2-oxoglutarate/2-oxoacid ferredoxin oxidoreductase subunit beta